ncbi:Mediator of RNA polymerase II transcription subunit 10b [Camellia lanceoleosa]|uniref:Mediator of RNA polymerase II transcription subunit 10b n=1 Tax=Camellia lanceoleosa TaxID=1840588 RepID=A0ACC0FP59_9ERIC|nr:Mediator of RNA polymerase II transcription subunit 10b [Camellia lanceoleosa]
MIGTMVPGIKTGRRKRATSHGETSASEACPPRIGTPLTCSDETQPPDDTQTVVEETQPGGVELLVLLRVDGYKPIRAPNLEWNSLVLELDTMTKMVDKCNIQIPIEFLNLIDEGKNPDEFTRDVLNGCIAKNQNTKGKIDAFKAFLDEVESYREIRATSAAESKRIAQAQSILPNGDVKVKPEL